MPIHIAAQAIFDGVTSVPLLWPTLKLLPWVALLVLLKWYFQGASNRSERNMHGRVVIVTGGTSGVGEATVRALASRGAQIVLLTQHALSDPFIVDYIEDMRRDTNNHLITAEHVDLSSLHNIRTFATKWIDNAPPRRLDMVILCANTLTPTSKSIQSTKEGIELNWQINYLANFHLLSILSPAIRAQPPDRDVRIIFGNCSSYMGGDLLHITQSASSTSTSSKRKPTTTTTPTTSSITHSPTQFSPGNAYATSKLALTTFAAAFAKHLAAHSRPDGFPPSTRVVLADPGLCRTPGTRRWLTAGTLFGLLIYLLAYPLAWLVLKSPDAGAQSFLFAAMEERVGRPRQELGAGIGGESASGSKKEEGRAVLVKECREREFLRDDVADEEVQKKLWEYSEQMVQEAEKRGATMRAREKKEAEDKKEEEDAAKELHDYKEKVGKKDGVKSPGSRRSKKAS